MNKPRPLSIVLDETLSSIDLIKRPHLKGDLYYPACPTSKALIDIMNRKAFTAPDLPKLQSIFKEIGIEVALNITMDY